MQIRAPLCLKHCFTIDIVLSFIMDIFSKSAKQRRINKHLYQPNKNGVWGSYPQRGGWGRGAPI